MGAGHDDKGVVLFDHGSNILHLAVRGRLHDMAGPSRLKDGLAYPHRAKLLDIHMHRGIT